MDHGFSDRKKTPNPVILITMWKPLLLLFCCQYYTNLLMYAFQLEKWLVSKSPLYPKTVYLYPHDTVLIWLHLQIIWDYLWISNTLPHSKFPDMHKYTTCHHYQHFFSQLIYIWLLVSYTLPSKWPFSFCLYALKDRETISSWRWSFLIFR